MPPPAVAERARALFLAKFSRAKWADEKDSDAHWGAILGKSTDAAVAEAHAAGLLEDAGRAELSHLQGGIPAAWASMVLAPKRLVVELGGLACRRERLRWIRRLAVQNLFARERTSTVAAHDSHHHRLLRMSRRASMDALPTACRLHETSWRPPRGSRMLLHGEVPRQGAPSNTSASSSSDGPPATDRVRADCCTHARSLACRRAWG